jgi:hypothetical protein
MAWAPPPIDRGPSRCLRSLCADSQPTLCHLTSQAHWIIPMFTTVIESDATPTSGAAPTNAVPLDRTARAGWPLAP